MKRLTLVDKFLGYITLKDFMHNPQNYLKNIEDSNLTFAIENKKSNFDPLEYLITSIFSKRITNTKSIPYYRNALNSLTKDFDYLSKNSDPANFYNWVMDVRSISGSELNSNVFEKLFLAMRNELDVIEDEATALINNIAKEKLKDSKNSCYLINLSNSKDNYKFFLKLKDQPDHESAVSKIIGTGQNYSTPEIIFEKKVGSKYAFLTEFIEAPAFMDYLNSNKSIKQTYPHFSNLSKILHDLQTKLHPYVQEADLDNHTKKLLRLNKLLPKGNRFLKKELESFGSDIDTILRMISFEEDASVYLDFSPQNIMLQDEDKYLIIDFENFNREPFWYDFISLFEFGKTSPNLRSSQIPYSNVFDMIKFGPAKNLGFEYVRAYRHFLYGLYAFRDVNSVSDNNGKIVPNYNTNYGRAKYHLDVTLNSPNIKFFSENMQAKIRDLSNLAESRNSEKPIKYVELDPKKHIF